MSLYEELYKDYPELEIAYSDCYIIISKDGEILLEIDKEDYRYFWDADYRIRNVIDSHRAGLKAYCRVKELEKEVAELRELVQALLYAPGGPEYLESKKAFEARIKNDFSRN